MFSYTVVVVTLVVHVGFLLSESAAAPTVSATCIGRCLTTDLRFAGDCFCDLQCTNFGDCCPDFDTLCAPTCVNRCGSLARFVGDCYCDSFCISQGDCCSDYSAVCLTQNPSPGPTGSPTSFPTTSLPTGSPTRFPTSSAPTARPTASPSTPAPSGSPNTAPTTSKPSPSPSTSPTNGPTVEPTVNPSTSPSKSPTTEEPTSSPTFTPTGSPTTRAPTADRSPTSENPTVPEGDICTTGRVAGVCKSVSSCEGYSIEGYCSGTSEIQCCITASGPGFVPEAPDTSGSLDTCQTTYDLHQGECINVAECTGATFRGYCPGGTDIQCCVPENATVNLVEDIFAIDQTPFETLFEGISSKRAAAFRPYLNLIVYYINADAGSEQEGCFRTAALIAQIDYQTNGLELFEETGTGEEYENQTDLGNTEPGDGMRFKGRGPFHLKGRFNYRTTGQTIGIDLEENPEAICFPSAGFESIIHLWQSRNLNRYAGEDTESGFETLTFLLTGGSSEGLSARKARYEEAKNVLNCASASTTSFTSPPSTDATPSPSSLTGSPTKETADSGAGQFVLIAMGVVCAGLFGGLAVFVVRKRRQTARDILEAKEVHYLQETVTTFSDSETSGSSGLKTPPLSPPRQKLNTPPIPPPKKVSPHTYINPGSNPRYERPPGL